jgi:pilus assembly protein CpaC
MKPSNRLINLLSLQLASLGLALSMIPAVADDAVPRSALSKNSDMSRMSGMNCSGVAASPSKVILPLGKSTMLRLPGPVSNRTLGNPNVAQAMLVSPESLYLLGMSIGTTNMILQEKNGSCSVIDVEVTMDPEALMQTFRELFPDEKNIRITAAADKHLGGCGYPRYV